MSTSLANRLCKLALALLAATSASGQEPFELPLENPSFAKGVDDRGVPLGWSKYGGGGKDQELRIVDGPDGGKALLIADGDPAVEIGVSQSFALKGGETYQVTAKVRAVAGGSTAGVTCSSVFCLPSNWSRRNWLPNPPTRSPRSRSRPRHRRIPRTASSTCTRTASRPRACW